MPLLGHHHSEESKHKLSEMNKGKPSPMSGKHHTEDTKLKISKANKGRHHSNEARRKMSVSRKNKPLSDKALEHILELNTRKKGVPLSEETKRKLSEAHKGIPSSRKGVKLSKETKEKISKNHRHYQSEEAKKKQSIINTGRKKSEEERKRMSERMKGHKLNLGHKHTPETIEKMRLAAHIIIMRPTKPELKLFEVVKSKYPDKEIIPNYRVETQHGNRFIDIAIPELLLGFEYDEPYWHPDKEKDAERHHLIEAEGWKLTHYTKESEFC